MTTYRVIETIPNIFYIVKEVKWLGIAISSDFIGDGKTRGPYLEPFFSREDAEAAITTLKNNKNLKEKL